MIWHVQQNVVNGLWYRCLDLAIYTDLFTLKGYLWLRTYAVFLHYFSNGISLITHSALFSFTTFQTKSLITALFSITTSKMKSLPTLTLLFKFSTIKLKYLTTLTTLFYFTTIILNLQKTYYFKINYNWYIKLHHEFF